MEAAVAAQVRKLKVPAPFQFLYMKLFTWNSPPVLYVWFPRIQVRPMFPVGLNAKIESAGSPPGVPLPKRIMPPCPMHAGGSDRFGAGVVAQSALNVGNLPVS